jgi:hypothetical protein
MHIAEKQKKKKKETKDPTKLSENRNNYKNCRKTPIVRHICFSQSAASSPWNLLDSRRACKMKPLKPIQSSSYTTASIPHQHLGNRSNESAKANQRLMKGASS